MSKLYDDIIAAADRSVEIFPLPSIDGMRVFPRYLIHSYQLYELVNEITRLRSELTDYKEAAASEADRVNELTAENESLREENARLRAALKPFADVADRWIGQQNREVLVMLEDCFAAASAIREGGK